MKTEFSKACSLHPIAAVAAIAALASIATPVGAAVIVPGTNVNGSSTYTVTGTLYAIDAPGGGSGGDASNVGWAQVSGANGDSYGNQAAPLRNAWEPDGTSYAATNIRWTGGPVTWTFDLADGTVINGIFANWAAQGNAGSANTYSWNEGTPDSAVRSHTSATPLDLRLNWAGFTSTGAATTYTSTFDQLNTGPITVSGGNGFTVTLTPQSGAFPFVDTIVLDVVPEPSSLAMGMVGLTLLLRRRRIN
jgi:hypothetical protein